MRLVAELFDATIKPAETVDQFISRVRKIQRELASLGQPVTEPMVVAALLRSLPASYTMVKEIRLHSAHTPADLLINTVKAPLMRVEQELKLTQGGASANYASANPGRRQGRDRGRGRVNGRGGGRARLHSQVRGSDQATTPGKRWRQR
jgi:hypothetical protein